MAGEAPPPPDVRPAIDGIVALLSGEKRDLTDIAIDDSGLPDFNKRVYAIVRKLPPGITMTYGEIAERLGDKALSRDVGQAMGENPTPLIMPCHRVLAAGGKAGGGTGAPERAPSQALHSGHQEPVLCGAWASQVSASTWSAVPAVVVT